METNLEIITSSHSAGTGEHGPALKLLPGAQLVEAILGPFDSTGLVQTSFRNVPDVDTTLVDRKSGAGRAESAAADSDHLEVALLGGAYGVHGVHGADS